MNRNYLATLILASLCLTAQAQTEPQLVINELMQSNVTSLMIENDYPDSWVELYNPGDADINLSGWRIWQSNDFASAYTLPSAVVPAKGHITIYCDKEDRGIHTNFRIDSGKTALYLFRKDGTVADFLSIAKMPSPDIAYGRVSDGADTWQYELTPTPGAENAGGGASQVNPAPVFNITGGLYDEGQQIIISMPEGVPADAGIFYTLDGSEPTRQSTASRNPYIYVNDTKTIRARIISVRGSALPSPVVTHSYIYHPRPTTLPVVSISTDEPNFFDSKYGILASNVNNGTPNYMQKWRRPINIEYFDNQNGSVEVFNQLAETAVSGVSTREQPQKSMKVYANKRFGTKNFKGNFFADKPKMTKMKSFVLRSGGNNASSTRVNDALLQRICGTHLPDLDWQAYQPVIVYLNGKYFGEFGLRERSDEDFVEANHGVEDVELADEVSYQTPQNGTLFQELFNLYTNSATTYEELASVIDVDNFIATMVAEIYGQNTDYPTNNVSLWTPTVGDTHWRWIVKDVDRFLAPLPMYPQSFDMIRYLFSPDDLQYGGLHHFDVYKKMISFPEVRERFIDLLSVSLGDYLKPEIVTALLDSMTNEIRDEVRATFSRYNYNYADFNQGITLMQRAIANRPAYLYQQLSDYFQLGSVLPLTVAENEMSVSVNGIKLTEGDFHGSWFAGRDITLSCDDVTCKWNVTVTIPDQEPTVYNYSGNEVTVPLSLFDLPSNASLSCEPIFASGIKEVKPTVSSADQPVYTISGQRVSGTSALPQLLISRGKKILGHRY